VRELKNAMQRAAALARGTQVFPEQLPERLQRASAAAAVEPARDAPRSSVELDESEQLRARLREVERARLVEVLERCTGNQTRAAKELGISRRTLVTRLQEYELPRPRKS
jgi:two-component system, NtrC family, response regulator AtoC